ncbi:uncharacterized protein LOC117108536 isoform X2 [Anneissia japonica]|uniref:uncharacterized protein LOC117108536 isoform X2 n=1 Tax=Anneissia japonica TaxID=1529436 RepID=UPI001425B5FD|nr:uncharacterized protein LOC117108536 isoform X2 [Anneissia japonica]
MTKLARKTILIILIFTSLILLVQSTETCGAIYSGSPSKTDFGDFTIASSYFLSHHGTIKQDLNCTYRLNNLDKQGAILLYFDYFYLNDNGMLRQGDTLKISNDPDTYYSYKTPQPRVYDSSTLNLTLTLHHSTRDSHIGFKACYKFLSKDQRLAWEKADKYIGSETVPPYHGGLIDQTFLPLEGDASVSPNNKVHYTWYIRGTTGSTILLNFLNIELKASTLEVWDADDSKVQIQMGSIRSQANIDQGNRRSLLSDGNFIYVRWVGEARQGDSIQVAYAFIKKEQDGDGACGEMYLPCQFGADSVCISNELTCDGINHCHDGEDEDELLCLTKTRSGQYPSYSNIAAIIGGAVCIFFLLLLSCMACVAYIRGPQPGRDINGIPHLISVEPIGRMSSFDEAAAIAHSDLPPCYLEVVLSKNYRTASTTTLTKIDECEEMPDQPPSYELVTSCDKPDAKVLEVQLNAETCQPETRIWEHRSKSRNLVNAMKKKKKTNNPFCQHCNRQYRHECRVNEDWVCL